MFAHEVAIVTCSHEYHEFHPWEIHLHHKKISGKKHAGLEVLFFKVKGSFPCQFLWKWYDSPTWARLMMTFQRLQGSPSPHKKNISYFIIFHLEHIWSHIFCHKSSTLHKKSPCPKQKLRVVSNLLYFYPIPGRRFPIWRAYLFRWVWCNHQPIVWYICLLIYHISINHSCR